MWPILNCKCAIFVRNFLIYDNISTQFQVIIGHIYSIYEVNIGPHSSLVQHRNSSIIAYIPKIIASIYRDSCTVFGPHFLMIVKLQNTFQINCQRKIASPVNNFDYLLASPAGPPCSFAAHLAGKVVNANGAKVKSKMQLAKLLVKCEM